MVWRNGTEESMDGASENLKPVVLLVDDEPPVLRAVERLLRGEPYDLLTTPDPLKALEWILSRKVSLVIADYRMPELCGSDLLEKVSTFSPETRRILFTGYPGEMLVLHGLGKGLYTLVGKPWDDAKLKELVRHLALEPAASEVD